MTIPDYNSAVDLHADGIYRFAVKHLRDEELAKDVVQESFARLWMKVHEVEGRKVKSYLFTTAHHLMVDEVRKGKRSTRMEEQHDQLLRTTTAQAHGEPALHCQGAGPGLGGGIARRRKPCVVRLT